MTMREVGIRLSVRDEEIVRRALKAIGSEGEAALKRIGQAAGPASVQLSVLNKSAAIARSAVGQMAMPALSSAAAMLSVGAAIDQTQAALERLGSIADASTASGLSPEYLQSIALQAKGVGVEFDQVAGALETFAKNSGLAAAGKGRMVETLRALNPELLRNIQLADTQEERVALVADALKGAKDQATAAAIASAAFGEAGTQLVAAFAGGGAEIRDTMAAAKSAGTIFQNELVAKADDWGDRLDAVRGLIDTQLKSAFVNLAPALQSIGEAIAGWLKMLNIVLDQFNAVESRVELPPLQNELVGVENQMAEIRQRIDEQRAELQKQAADSPVRIPLQFQIDTDQADFDALQQRAMALQERIYQLMGKPRDVGGAWGGGWGKDGLGQPKPAVVDAAVLPTTSASGRGSGSGRAAQASEVDTVTAALRRQLEALQLTDREQAIATELAKAHVTAASADGREIAQLTGALYDQKRALDAANEAAGFFAESFEGGLEGLITGSTSLGDVLGDLVTQLERAALQAALLGQGPLAGLMGTGGGGTGGLGGLFGQLAGSLFGGAAGGTGWGALTKSADGNVFSGGPLAAYHHRIVDRPTIFPFARGVGLMGEAGPEAIIPLRRDSAGRLGVGGNAPVVNVTIVKDAREDRVEQTSRPDGGIDLRVMVRGAVNEGLAAGSFDAMLSSLFGLSRRGV